MSEHDQVGDSIRPNNRSNALTSCILAVVAAVATWSVLEAKHPFFTVSDEYSIGMGSPVVEILALQSQQARVDRLNAAVVFAIGGALLSGVLALFASGCCSPPLRLLVALPWGAATGFVGVIAYSAIIPNDELPNATKTGFAQAAAFAMLGAGVGLLFGAFSGNARTTATSAVTGALAGAAGAIAFPIITGLVMPTQNTLDLVPTASIVRALWLGLPFAAIGLAIPGMCNR